jgi:aspartate oxidase
MKDYVNKNLQEVNKNDGTPVLIIGGGLAGLTCAYNFMKNNIKFILVDRQKLANGVSASTTAQITIAHDSLYDNIMTKHGEEKAIEYLKSQIEGLETIKSII